MTLVHVLIIIAVSIRVIQVRLPVATSLAWLLLVFFLPLVGAIAYLVLGEKRLGHKFAARSQAIKARYDSWLVFHSGCSGASFFTRSKAKRIWVYMGYSTHKVPSWSKTAMRSAGST